MNAPRFCVVNISDSNPAACREAEVIFICVKPGDIEKVLLEIRDEVRDKLVVSTAAIVPLEFYESTAPLGRYVRTMPNVAAIVGESFTLRTRTRPDIGDDGMRAYSDFMRAMGYRFGLYTNYTDFACVNGNFSIGHRGFLGRVAWYGGPESY